MISNRTKTKRVMFTTHNRGMRRLAARIEAKPVEDRTADERRTLAGIHDEERGIRTLADVQEARAERARAEREVAEDRTPPKEVRVAAAPAKEPKAEKGAKGGKKKKA